MPIVGVGQDLLLDEHSSARLSITDSSRSPDTDGSEVLSLDFTLPLDGGTPIGTLTATNTSKVALFDNGDGKYTVKIIDDNLTSQEKEDALNAFISDASNGIIFTPRLHWSGSLNATDGITVEAVSTEEANGVELAPSNDTAAGTADDLNTKESRDFTYISVNVTPVIEILTVANATITVQENNGVSDGSDPLVVQIGQTLGLSTPDVDGSETIDLVVSGIPIDATNIGFSSPLPASLSGTGIIGIDPVTGTVTFPSGANSKDVLDALGLLEITLKDDDDENFVITVDFTLTDTNGPLTVTEAFSVSQTVIVEAVADTPVVTVTQSTFPAVDENATFSIYPVTVDLNDDDGSETYQSIVISFSTNGVPTSTRPEIEFGVSTGVTIVEDSVAQTITLTGGTTAQMEAAMLTLMIHPGDSNGENIKIIVNATAIESNPNGGEVAVLTASYSTEFEIPVNPVIITQPTITLTAPSYDGTEDIDLPLGSIMIGGITPDDDGSEKLFFDILLSDIPEGTTFDINGAEVTNGIDVVRGGKTYLRLPVPSATATLTIDPPSNWSGAFNLKIRATLIDTTSDGDTTESSSIESVIGIKFKPVSDGFEDLPSSVTGVEDTLIAFGAKLALKGTDTDPGWRLRDRPTNPTANNNAETEILSQIKLVGVPTDPASDFIFSGLYMPNVTSTNQAGFDTARVSYDSTTKEIIITSTIITNAPDVGAVSNLLLEQAESDILKTLETFFVKVLGTHADEDTEKIDVTFTSLDRNPDGMVCDDLEESFQLALNILAVADTPTIATTKPVGDFSEDMGNVPLLNTIIIGPSPDGTDKSEFLTVYIQVPEDGVGPVGTIILPSTTVSTQIDMTDLGDGLYEFVAKDLNTTAADQATDLNLFFDLLEFAPRSHWAGDLTVNEGLEVTVVSKEKSSFADSSYGGPDNTSETETVTAYIDIIVLRLCQVLRPLLFPAQRRPMIQVRSLPLLLPRYLRLCQAMVPVPSPAQHRPMIQVHILPLLLARCLRLCQALVPAQCPVQTQALYPVHLRVKPPAGFPAQVPAGSPVPPRQWLQVCNLRPLQVRNLRLLHQTLHLFSHTHWISAVIQSL
jgi:hypothetical protein